LECLTLWVLLLLHAGSACSLRSHLDRQHQRRWGYALHSTTALVNHVAVVLLSVLPADGRAVCCRDQVE
jgi:hypothetical protein